jgi:molybdenum ABC transporter molybdate-binding protein
MAAAMPLHAHAVELNVSAASSLTDALKELAANYEKEAGDRIVFNFGASSLLARQIKEHAPADVFLSAGEAQMDALQKDGFIAPETRRDLLSNTLVIIAPTRSSLTIDSLVDLATKAQKLAVADPRAVPAGIYTKQYLSKLGLWDKLEPKIVPTENVRAALAAVESGNVDVGFVYKTDASISKKVKVIFSVPAESGPAISYPIAVTKDAKDKKAAKKFVLYLESDNALKVFEKYGFIVNAPAAEPKRVLLIHSFASAAPPFTVLATAFETELAEKMGERVDVAEVSLDMARYADRDMQEVMVDYLQKRQGKWQPDLVVTIGSPAASFVANYRERLFPGTPILYTVGRQLLPPNALEKNATYVGQEFDLPGFLEDVLQVAPATKNIAVIVGATPLEQRWQEAFQKAVEPLAERIKFTYYSDLSFGQMKERVSTLPPHSYIFFLLLLRDAAGVTLNADEALQRLHAVANAPINSMFEHQLGLGIVGGRLYEIGRPGKEAADFAIRILHGEPASSLSPKVFERSPPRYDWRELQRWNINEKLLPPGSTVVFRVPTVWDRYREWIIAGVSIFILQGLLITGLLANLVKRRRAERFLTESEKRFQTMADAAPVLIWMAGEDKLCTFFNKAWLAFTGRRMEQELGNGWSEGVHPDDFENCVQTYVTAFDAREPFTMKYRLRRHDGEYRFITDSGAPRFGKHGNFQGYVGACVDVTDLLKQQKALHEFEERVTLAAEAAHLGVWELNTITNELWMSDKARELFQFPLEGPVTYTELQGRAHPEDRAMRDAALERSIETQAGYEIEYRALLPDGSVHWINGRACWLSDEKGNLTRLLGVSVDVTERKEAQELFQVATEASTSGILLIDGQGRILLVNAQTEKLFNYWRDELIGTPVELLLPDGFVEHFFEKFVAAPQVQIMGEGKQLFGRQKDGSKFPVEIGLNPVQTPRGILILVSVVNITARKLAEEQERKARDEINRLSRISLLGVTTASIAHEINQPLSAISSNTNAGQRIIDRGDVKMGTLREILVDIGADVRRASEVISNIRNTIKKGAVIRKRIHMNDVITDVTHLVRPDIFARSCQLQLSLAKNLPVVEGDPIQIQQVLINLVMNACDAMRNVSPNRRNMEIATEPNGRDSIRVSVRDHGTGISDEAREHLFDQFFTTKADGLGMGLAIVRSIIEAHGGEINAENVKGGGARFRFTLPAAKNG